MPDNNKIEIQAFDFYKRIYEAHLYQSTRKNLLREKYVYLKEILDQVCHEQTRESEITFANLFARLDFICKEKGISPADNYAIQTMRRNCNEILSRKAQGTEKDYQYDLRALARFIMGCYNEKIPEYLLTVIPNENRPFKEKPHKKIGYIRAAVAGVTDQLIFANTDLKETHSIVIDYRNSGYDDDMAYLKDILKVNMQINLIDVKVDENNHYLPRLIVVNPDYLIDISTLSACFTEYGYHPYNYFLNRLKPRPNTSHILMGNLAGMLLDEYVNETPDHPVSYKDTINTFFASSALEFCTCSIPDKFHSDAQSQMLNIQSFVNHKLSHDIPEFDKDKNMLEASFICERLGLQGRVDMLQKDFKILVEQKAGKRDEFHNCSRQSHYIQMMLYQAVLMHNFGLKEKDTKTFLLYSKYADGLTLERRDTTTFRLAIQLRNYIVALEEALSQGKVNELIEELNTEDLNQKGTTGTLWTRYQKPELESMISTLKNASPYEKAYFCRFYTFIMKEQLLNKTGGGNDSSRGFASVWQTPVREKKESGNILTDLKLIQKEKSSADRGYDTLTLSIPQEKDDFIPNFRKGDMVILYTYDDVPDVRKHILMRGSIIEMGPENISVRLRNGQQHSEIIGTEDDIFAIEHDSSDVSTSGGIKGLYAFLNALQSRKDLLLGKRKPECNPYERLNGSYGRFDHLILKEKQAKDYFLLVGPPGTGKTSCALRYMVEEALTDPNNSLLLLSYTNRAVDEICSMLVSSGIAQEHPFLRIGNELSCDPRFTPYLLDKAIKGNLKLNLIKQKLMSTRIYVGTTTSINSRSYLFNIKHFNMAIIDEASQILEPDIIGILSARYNNENAIDKFVLIGDYKQLPAIAIQNEKDAMVNDRLMLEMGIKDCRNSLFERLYRQTPETCRDILNKQGRMHPSISEFPDSAFYFKENLCPVPLPHQEEEWPFSQKTAANDRIDQLLQQRRMIFVPAYPPQYSECSDKANPEEAKVVTEIVRRIYRISGKDFDCNKTVGIIVPYRNQIAMIRNELKKTGINELMNLSVDTVERYQGSQRDVIVYSFTVRNYSQLNFLVANTFSEGDHTIDRKLNVAITRARKQLIMTGNPKILGANLTFYKLMEYIRIHQGYIDTDAEHFCRCDFEIPGTTCCPDQALSLPSQKMSHQVLQAVVNMETPKKYTWTACMEMTEYGRWNYTRQSDEIPVKEVNEIYNFYFLGKQYDAAYSLFSQRGNWINEAIKNAGGRILICDLSYECGATVMAFADAVNQQLYCEIDHVSVCYSQEMKATTAALLQAGRYDKVKTSYCKRLQDITAAYWYSHSVMPSLIIFNVSNYFDRIHPQEAKQTAIAIKNIMRNYKLNHYVVCYRDDAGERSNTHTYEAFCNELEGLLKPISNQMPEYGLQPDHNNGKYVFELLSSLGV